MPLKLPDTSNPNVRLRMSLYLGAMAIFGLLFLAAAFPLSSNPVFCGRVCHNMNPEYQTWQKSSHAKVTCYACHINPSFIHLLQDKLFVAPPGILHTYLNEHEKPINKESEYSQRHVPAERCLRCHSPDKRNFTGRKGLNVTSAMHMKHLDNGLQCTTCHNRIAHLNAEKYEPIKTWQPGFKYKNFITMRQGCWRCHSKDIKFRSEETLEIVAGKSPSTNCALCHNAEGNLKPTVGQYSHDDVDGVPWRNGKLRHGVIAKLDFNSCFACHQMKPGEQAGNTLPNCTTTCHKGVTMPHNIPARAAYYAKDKETPQWLRAHPYVADEAGVAATPDFKAGDPNVVCSMCHNKDRAAANFCQKCHHKTFDKANSNPNAPWKLQHPSVVKEIGSTGCQKCHLLEFCAFCHTNGQKPARGLFLNRAQQAAPVEGQELSID